MDSQTNTQNSTLVLLENMSKIITVSQQRACWKPEEMSTIGSLYDTIQGEINKLKEVQKITSELNTIKEDDNENKE